jgi:hypothetical protein
MGYGKAAQRIGYNFDVYRPSAPMYSPPTPSYALSPLNKITTLPASFTVGATKFNFEKAPNYKDMVWSGLFDGTAVHAGDYLNNSTHGVYFVAAMPDILPILCVRCNHTVSLVCPPVNTAVGVLGYNGTTAASETSVMTQWPAFIMYMQKGRVTEVGLPMDLPSPYYTVLLPSYAGLLLRSGDIVKDEMAQRYVVSVAELSMFGWRLECQIAVT